MMFIRCLMARPIIKSILCTLFVIFGLGWMYALSVGASEATFLYFVIMLVCVIGLGVLDAKQVSSILGSYRGFPSEWSQPSVSMKAVEIVAPPQICRTESDILAASQRTYSAEADFLHQLKLWCDRERETGIAFSQQLNDIMNVIQRTESPIERLFLISFINEARDSQFDIRYRVNGDLIARSVRATKEVSIEPQAIIQSFRVDFLIQWETSSEVETAKRRSVIVECDGFEFHETPERATADKQRDRHLQMAGHQVFRFSGSELFRSSVTCGKQVIAHIRNLS